MTYFQTWRALQLLPLVLLIAFASACAQAPAPTTETADAESAPDVRTPEMQAVDDVAMAHQLSAYGERAGSALALTAAAEILIQNSPQVIAEQPEAEEADGEGGAVQDKPAGAEPALQAPPVLARARQLAAGDEQLLAQIERLEGEAEAGRARGAVGGAQVGSFRVEAFTTNIHRRSFRASEAAIVHIEGDGDTLLDLVIYDGNGNFITADRGKRWGNTVRWVPRWTGAFRIEVVNHGSVWNRYYFAHN